VALGYDPFEAGARPAPPAGAVPEELRGFLPSSFDPRAVREASIPLEAFRRRWSAMILHGTALLARHNANAWHLSYADLVSAPQRILRQLVEFLELPAAPRSWLDWAATQPKPPRSPKPEPAREELESLRRACEPGERRLRELRASA